MKVKVEKWFNRLVPSCGGIGRSVSEQAQRDPIEFYQAVDARLKRSIVAAQQAKLLSVASQRSHRLKP